MLWAPKSLPGHLMIMVNGHPSKCNGGRLSRLSFLVSSAVPFLVKSSRLVKMELSGISASFFIVSLLKVKYSGLALPGCLYSCWSWDSDSVCPSCRLKHLGTALYRHPHLGRCCTHMWFSQNIYSVYKESHKTCSLLEILHQNAF